MHDLEYHFFGVNGSQLENQYWSDCWRRNFHFGLRSKLFTSVKGTMVNEILKYFATWAIKAKVPTSLISN